MSRKTEIRHILEDTLTVNSDGVIEGISKVSEKLDEFIDEKMVEEKEIELFTDKNGM